MHEPGNGRELFPHNFADQTWIGSETFQTTPHNLVNAANFYTWNSLSNGVFRDSDHFTGYIDDGAVYTTDTMTANRTIGVLTSVDAGAPYIVKFTNKHSSVQGILHWLTTNSAGALVELSHNTFTATGREFIAPAGATQMAVGFKGAVPINTRIVANFGVLTKGGTSVQSWIEGVLDGSIKVGDSDKLDGKDSSYFYFRHEAEKLISDLKDGTIVVKNSYLLDGHPASYFATKQELTTFRTDYDKFVNQILNGPLTVDNSNKLGGISADQYLLKKDAVKVYSGQGAPGVITGAKLNDLYIQLKQ